MPNEKQIKHDDVLNADEASTWLKIPKSTLYKLCSEGELPAAKVGRHWRFHRETLEQWLLNMATIVIAINWAYFVNRLRI